MFVTQLPIISPYQNSDWFRFSIWKRFYQKRVRKYFDLYLTWVVKVISEFFLMIRFPTWRYLEWRIGQYLDSELFVYYKGKHNPDKPFSYIFGLCIADAHLTDSEPLALQYPLLEYSQPCCSPKSSQATRC